jgi:hypothetical protein
LGKLDDSGVGLDVINSVLEACTVDSLVATVISEVEITDGDNVVNGMDVVSWPVVEPKDICDVSDVASVVGILGVLTMVEGKLVLDEALLDGVTDSKVVELGSNVWLVDDESDEDIEDVSAELVEGTADSEVV